MRVSIGGILAGIGLCAGLAAVAEGQGELVVNPGFEQPGGWELELRQGAAGSAERDAMQARSGQYSMRLTKTNGVGFVILRSAEPIAVKRGVRYTFTCYFHAEDAPPASALLLLRMTHLGAPLYYDAIDQSEGWMSQSLLINSPAGHWTKRVISFSSDRDQSIYPHIVLYGNPCSVWVDDLEFTDRPAPGKPQSFSKYETPYSAEQALQIVASRPNSTAQVAVQAGRSVLLVNGEPTLPVMYKSEPYFMEDDFARFGAAGVPLATVSIRLGSINKRPGTWVGSGKYNFAGADADVLLALRRNPRAYLVVDLDIYPYGAWGAENPSECWTNEKGERAFGAWGNVEGFTNDLAKLNADGRGRWFVPSYNSEKWRRDASAAIAALITHLKGTPAWKTIVGFFITSGHDGQFQVWSQNDYSPATRDRFRKWCETRYKTIDAVNRAYGTALKGFGEIDLSASAPSDKGPEAVGPPYLGPGREVDYREFAEDDTWQLRDTFAAAVKTAAGKPVVTIAYGNPPQYDFSPFLRTQYLDATASMSYYPYRRPGYSPGYRPMNSFALYGKLFCQELDLRSWVIGRGANEVSEAWIGAGSDLYRWRAIQRKLVGISLANECGYWYYDMNHFFDDAGIMRQISHVCAATSLVRSKPVDRVADVVVIREGGANKYVNAYAAAVKEADWYQVMQLETSGVPYDMHFLDDVLSRSELQHYKVYVFMNCRYLDKARRNAIRQKLEGGGRTLVFLYDTGYIGEQGKGSQEMSSLIGMNVATEEGHYARLTAQVAAGGPAWLRDVLPFQGMSELMATIMSSTGPSSFVARCQPFWIDDPGATPLARYAETGKVAMAVRETRDWTSIYLAAPNALGGDLLNAIAQKSGAYVVGDAGQSIAMNGNFLSLHGMRTAAYTLTLPEGKRRVVDADTGKELAHDVTTYTLPVEAQWTYWLRFE